MNLHDAWHIRLEAEREAKIKSLEKEIARLRLTDAEREALRKVLRLLREGFFRDSSIELVQAASVIDGLLDRQG